MNLRLIAALLFTGVLPVGLLGGEESPEPVPGCPKPRYPAHEFADWDRKPDKKRIGDLVKFSLSPAYAWEDWPIVARDAAFKLAAALELAPHEWWLDPVHRRTVLEFLDEFDMMSPRGR